jgi:hypothetical protein
VRGAMNVNYLFLLLLFKYASFSSLYHNSHDIDLDYVSLFWFPCLMIPAAILSSL